MFPAVTQEPDDASVTGYIWCINQPAVTHGVSVPAAELSSPALLPSQEQSEWIRARAVAGSLVTTEGSEWSWTIRTEPVMEPYSLMESSRFDFLPPGQRWGLRRS